MAKYYDFAVQRASNCFKRKKSSSAFWDNRIEEENIVRDAAIDALQNVYVKYDPDKGALESYLSRAVHNEVVDKLEKRGEMSFDGQGHNPRTGEGIYFG